MKKITTLFLLFVAALVVMMPTFAEDGDLVDIYPYDDPNALYGPSTPFTLVGDSNWDLEFLGHRYHFVRGGVRFAHLWTDADADGLIAPTDYPALSWNAFAVMTINDGEDEIEMSTESARTDITTSVHRLYAYFNEEGELMMFEDHFFTYYIHNDGTDVYEDADWRLATEAEIDAFDAAANPAVDTPNTRLTHVRIMRDETDEDGYVLEPLVYLKWVNADLAALTGEDAVPESEQTLLLDYNPDHVVIPAGWTVVSFGTNDRGAYSATDFVKMFVPSFLEEEAPKMNRPYEFPDPVFAGISSHDDDGATPGTQMIVEFNAPSFDLPNDISVTWIKMYDEDGFIVNQTEKLSYKVEIFDVADYNLADEDHVPTPLQTINFVYDADADTYTPDAALTVVDSSGFGNGYIALYSAEHPENGLTEVEVEIAVGVLPPKFTNVKKRFADEGVFVDLLGDIKADDGYGNDLTNTIKVTPPAGFNMYNPKPGTYQINLEFTYNVFIAGDPSTPDSVEFNGVDYVITQKNTKLATVANDVSLYTDVENLKTTTFSWGSAGVIIEVDGDGNIIRTINRRTWELVDQANPLATAPGDASGMFDDWLSGITLEENGFVVIIGVNLADAYDAARTLNYEDSVVLNEGLEGTPDFSQDIVTKTSYELVIDDKTAPQLVVVDNQYTVESDRFTSVDNAILANVVAIDNFDTRSQLSLYVLDNGNMAMADGKLLPGTYQVIVGAADRAGNETEVAFTVVVKQAKPTQQDLEEKVTEVENKVDEVENKVDETKDEVDNRLTPEQVDKAIEDALKANGGVNVLTAVLMSLGAALVAFGGSALLFFMKKK